MTPYAQIASNKLKTYLILALFAAFFSLVFYLLGEYYGNTQGFFAMGLFFSVATSVSSFFWSDKLVLSMAHARPASKKEFFDFYTVAENVAIASGLPMPKLYVIDDAAPNAFATGRDAKHAVVAVTTGLLAKLDRAELEGVIAHEFGHIKNSDMLLSTVVAVLVGTLVFVVDFVSRSLWWGRGNDDSNSKSPLGMIVFVMVLLLTPILASLIQLSISRKREYLADATGALTTRNPDALADALLKIAGDPHPTSTASNAIAHLYIENPFKSGEGKGKWLANLFSTHPPTEDRVRILREM